MNKTKKKLKEDEKEKEILQILYDEGIIDFSGDEEDLTLHTELKGQTLIDIYKLAELKGRQEAEIEWIEKLRCNSKYNVGFEAGKQEATQEQIEDEIKFLERFDLRDLDSVEIIDWNGETIWADKYVQNRLDELKQKLKQEKLR